MKTKIEPSDIREGDLIRVEFIPSATLHSLEFRATVIGSGYTGQHYLLDRPKPAVELPRVPTLGWATGATFDPLVAVWFHAPGSETFRVPVHSVRADDITAFTEAVAVPKAALDELRKWESVALSAAVGKFLAAVDAANGPRA